MSHNITTASTISGSSAADDTFSAHSDLTDTTTTTTTSPATQCGASTGGAPHHWKPGNDRFASLMAEAKTLAEAQHKQIQARKALRKTSSTKADSRKRKRALDKRAQSSLKSAEICRVKFQLYPKLLEREVQREEKEYLDLISRTFEMTAKLMRANQLIADAEHRRAYQHRNPHAASPSVPSNATTTATSTAPSSASPSSSPSSSTSSPSSTSAAAAVAAAADTKEAAATETTGQQAWSYQSSGPFRGHHAASTRSAPAIPLPQVPQPVRINNGYDVAPAALDNFWSDYDGDDQTVVCGTDEPPSPMDDDHFGCPKMENLLVEEVEQKVHKQCSPPSMLDSATLGVPELFVLPETVLPFSTELRC